MPADGPCEELFARLRTAVAPGDAASTCAAIKQVLQEDLTRGVSLPAEFLQPDPAGYARRCLYRDPTGRFSVVVMVWDTQQRTPLHDHAGHWCVECVYAGRIEVTSFEIETQQGEEVRFREAGRIRAGVGEAGALIPPFEYHVIANPFGEKAVTVHVYEGEITWCHAFQPTERAGWYRRARHELAYNPV